jgi:hypothetical protein
VQCTKKLLEEDDKEEAEMNNWLVKKFCKEEIPWLSTLLLEMWQPPPPPPPGGCYCIQKKITSIQQLMKWKQTPARVPGRH